MRAWLLVVIIGLATLSSGVIVYCTVQPMMKRRSEIEIITFEGSDSNNDAKIDHIAVVVINAGIIGEEIMAIDFSAMSKTWNLTEAGYPIEVASASEVSIIVAALTNQDQITDEDAVHVAFYLVSEGPNDPVIVIDGDDLLKEDQSFTLRNPVTYTKDYPYSSCDGRLLLLAIIILQMAMVSLLLLWLWSARHFFLTRK